MHFCSLKGRKGVSSVVAVLTEAQEAGSVQGRVRKDGCVWRPLGWALAASRCLHGVGRGGAAVRRGLTNLTAKADTLRVFHLPDILLMRIIKDQKHIFCKLSFFKQMIYFNYKHCMWRCLLFAKPINTRTNFEHVIVWFVYNIWKRKKSSLIFSIYVNQNVFPNLSE